MLTLPFSKPFLHQTGKYHEGMAPTVEGLKLRLPAEETPLQQSTVDSALLHSQCTALRRRLFKPAARNLELEIPDSSWIQVELMVCRKFNDVGFLFTKFPRLLNNALQHTLHRIVLGRNPTHWLSLNSNIAQPSLAGCESA
jgi:hypothetical protein